MKDSVELIAKIVAIIGGLIATFKLLEELRENRKQRTRELRWKQSNSSRELLKELHSSKLAKDAANMIDWTGREYSISPHKNETITFEEVREALRVAGRPFNDKEVYIRDSIDSFLFYIELIEQAIQNELTQFKDIQYPTEYYLKALKKNGLYNAFILYVNEYGFTNAGLFFNRFVTSSFGIN